jgi:hypothetical protein
LLFSHAHPALLCITRTTQGCLPLRPPTCVHAHACPCLHTPTLVCACPHSHPPTCVHACMCPHLHTPTLIHLRPRLYPPLSTCVVCAHPHLRPPACVLVCMHLPSSTHVLVCTPPHCKELLPLVSPSAQYLVLLYNSKVQAR